jgi:hypothetical protein
VTAHGDGGGEKELSEMTFAIPHLSQTDHCGFVGGAHCNFSPAHLQTHSNTMFLSLLRSVHTSNIRVVPRDIALLLLMPAQDFFTSGKTPEHNASESSVASQPDKREFPPKPSNLLRKKIGITLIPRNQLTET